MPSLLGRRELGASVFNKDKHMRKGTFLLLLTAVAAATCAWLMALGSDSAYALTLEATDSGAPSAIVIFPVGEKPNPAAAGMPPVAFNHVIHEKWMAKAGKDCMVCHHTGDPIACTNCHTVQGSPEGQNITLQQAMHTLNIKQRKEYTPNSCVSCHAAQTRERNCAGCHTQLVRNARSKSSWCAVCHTITPAMTVNQMQAGMNNKLSERDNEKLAVDTAVARVQTSYVSPLLAPYKVHIDSLKGKYEAANFNHRHHIQSMMDRIQDSRLAGAFHTQTATMCMTCHHNTPASLTPPKCISCHTTEIDRIKPSQPRLMAAFHLECMNCHTDMQVVRPRNTDCQTCHKIRPVQGFANKGE